MSTLRLHVAQNKRFLIWAIWAMFLILFLGSVIVYMWNGFIQSSPYPNGKYVSFDITADSYSCGKNPPGGEMLLRREYTTTDTVSLVNDWYSQNGWLIIKTTDDRKATQRYNRTKEIVLDLGSVDTRTFQTVLLVEQTPYTEIVLETTTLICFWW